MQKNASTDAELSFFCEDPHYAVDVNCLDETSAGTCDIDVEKILLSMCKDDADTETASPCKKAKIQASNRACAKQSRDADRMLVELLLVELNRITETFENYASYIGQLKCHAQVAECSRDLDLRCLTHKTKILHLQKPDDSRSMPTLLGKTTKERNRIHAENSRRKKNNYLQDLLIERDASMKTLNEVIKYTTNLESSCTVLIDFYEISQTFMELMQVQQRLFERTCTHTRQQETLKSRLAFREVFRTNFR